MMNFTKEQYKTILTSWANVKEHSVIEHVLYNILRGKATNLGFKSIESKSKIVAFGNDPDYAFNQAVYTLRNQFNKKSWSYNEKKIQYYKGLFGIEFTDELEAKIVEVLNAK